ncbi:hypothetical protein AOLI_G00313330 [Acnodon oligacanthus]
MRECGALWDSHAPTGRQLASLEGIWGPGWAGPGWECVPGPSSKEEQEEGGGGGGGEPLAGAAFILPTELITKSLQAANQERSLSAKRGFWHRPRPSSPQGLYSHIKASHRCFPPFYS